MKRVGVDIGGTFTDLVVLDEATGSLKRTKTLTTPRAPEDGFLTAVADQHIDVDEVSHFLHGTTLVTNLIIERTGAKVGLITTEGFQMSWRSSVPIAMSFMICNGINPGHWFHATCGLRSVSGLITAAASSKQWTRARRTPLCSNYLIWASTRLPFVSSMPMPTQ